MKYTFYKREEIKQARREKRNPEPSFSLTCFTIGLRYYLTHLQLEEDYIWMEN